MLSLSLRAVLRELEAAAGPRVAAVAAWSGWEYRILLEDGTEIVASVHPDHNSLYRAPSPGGADGPANVLTRSLARALEGAHLVRAAQAGLDRVAALVFAGRDRLGDPRSRQLVVELTGKAANLVLLDGDEPFAGRVLDRLRADRSTANPRSLTGGATYTLPASTRADVLRDPPAALAAALERARAGRPPAEALAAAWEGIGPRVAEEFWRVASRGGEPDTEAVVVAWRAWVDAVAPPHAGHPAGARFAPCVVAARNGGPIALPFTPSAANEGAVGERAEPAVESYATMGEALAAAHRRFRHGERDERGSHLGRAVQTAIKKIEKALAALEREAAAETEAERLRRSAEAILAAAASIPRGVAEAEIPDPAGGEPLVVKLNPALGAAENAELYFKKARKAGRSGDRIAERRDALATQHDTLLALRDDLAAFGEGEPDTAWLERAKALGVPLPEAYGEKVKSNAPEDELGGALKPRSYDLGNGWEVLIGKSDKSNHILTFEIARPDDVWMHASGCPGSHVVLRHHEKGKQPPRDVLLTAAAFAAYFSKARNSTKVPVTVAEKRHVRRPRKAPLGQALVGEHKTLMVGPLNPDRRRDS